MKKIIISLLTFTLFLLLYGRVSRYPNYPDRITINPSLSQKRFYIQIGAFKNRRYVLIVAKKLKKLSYKVVIIRRVVGTRYYYKLLIGSYRSRREAEFVKNRVPREYKDAFILSNIEV